MEREPVYTIIVSYWGEDNVFLHKGLKEHPSREAYSSHESAMNSAYKKAIEEAKDSGLPEDHIKSYSNGYKIEFNEEECVTFYVLELTWKD